MNTGSIRLTDISPLSEWSAVIRSRHSRRNLPISRSTWALRTTGVGEKIQGWAEELPEEEVTESSGQVTEVTLW